MKIGLRMPGMQRELGSSGVIKWAAGIGIQSIDLTAPDEELVSTIRSYNMALGSVDFSGTWDLLSPDPKRQEAGIQAAKKRIADIAAVGGEVLFEVLGPADPSQSRRDSFAIWKDTYPEIVSAAEEHGVKIAIEPYPGPMPYLPNLGTNPDMLRRMFEVLPSEALGICYDPSHMARLGIDYIRVLFEFKDRIHWVHAKDCKMISEGEYLYGTLGETFSNTYICGDGSNRLNIGPYREYISLLLGDPKIRSKVSNRIAAHSYGTDYSTDRLTTLRQYVRMDLQQYNNAEYWMTEYCIMRHGRDLSIDSALFMARVIHHDLTVLDASAWHWWLAVSPYDYKDGLIFTDYKSTGEQNIIESKLLWALGNYSKFIRPGAQRIQVECADTHDDLMVSAYLDKDEENVIVVVTNMSANDVNLNIEFRNMPCKAATHTLIPHVTSDQSDLEQKDMIQSNSTYVMKARSIVTLVSKQI